MPQLHSVNRRGTTRVAVDLQADARSAGDSRARRITDLCLDGAFLEGEHGEPGACLKLNLRLGDGLPPLRARGVIVRRSERGAAVRFVEMRAKEMARIAESVFGA